MFRLSKCGTETKNKKKPSAVGNETSSGNSFKTGIYVPNKQAFEIKPLQVYLKNVFAKRRKPRKESNVEKQKRFFSKHT